MSKSKNLGVFAEQLAEKYLLNLGHEILDQNWVYNKAEIDLISYIDNTIVFTEVKARHGFLYGTPETFVDELKIKNIKRAAEEYIHLVNHSGEIRFDIISILFKEDETYTIKHIDDAFWPD